MKKMSLLITLISLCAGPLLVHAQDMDIPAGSVVRMANYKITGDRLGFSDILQRARALEFDENAPNLIFFRRPIYATPDYHENYDFQIAQWYSSFNEMRERRSASGNSSYGRLGVECDPGFVVRQLLLNQGDGLDDQSLMTTRFCNTINGAGWRDVYTRLSQGAANMAADHGITTLGQIWLPALGGPMNTAFDFVYAQVGTDGEELMQRLDVFREGYRPVNGEREQVMSCERASLWSTNRVYQRNQ